MLPPFSLTQALSGLTGSDLQRLVDDQVEEGIEIDYKIELPKDAVEFCRDLSAFANKRGGYLVFGVEEANKRPVALRPLTNFEGEKTLGRLHNWALEGIRPRLSFRLQPVTTDGGGVILVAEIPQSWNGPHQVRQGHAFYIRNQNGKDPMDVDELRTAFGLTRNLSEAAEAFRAKRIAYWSERTANIGSENALMIIHLLPLASIAGRLQIDLSPKSGQRWPVDPPLGGAWGRSGFDFRPNLDGVLFHTTGSPLTGNAWQLFRNGALEHKLIYGSRVFSQQPETVIPTVYVDQSIFHSIKDGLRVLRDLQVEPPAAITVSLVGVKGWEWPTGSRRHAAFGHPKVEEDQVLAPEILVDSFDGEGGQVAQDLSTFLWNAVGMFESPNFEGGEFKAGL